MTDHELRELDDFCAEKVMGWKKINPAEMGWALSLNDIWASGEESPTYQQFRPTVNRYNAMQVLEKCAEKAVPVIVRTTQGYVVYESHNYATTAIDAPTLPLAICLFGKNLFSK